MDYIYPRFSIVIPFHWMDNWSFFLDRCLKSIQNQTFTDYEIVMAKVNTMPITTNTVMDGACGELVKIIYMDDFLAHPNALEVIDKAFTPETQWLATGCLHSKGENQPLEKPHVPTMPNPITNFLKGQNTIGSPSVVTLRNEGHLDFDDNLSWLLDCDLYYRYYMRYGEPKLIEDLNVAIGVGEHQMTYKLGNEDKLKEHNYLLKKYA